MLVCVMARWIRGLGAGRGVVENSDYGVGRAVGNDPVESKSVRDGVRGREGGESSAGLHAAFVMVQNVDPPTLRHEFRAAIGVGVVGVVRVKRAM